MIKTNYFISSWDSSLADVKDEKIFYEFEFWSAN